MVILLKKLISFCLGFCCLSIFNQADALEFDKKAIMKELTEFNSNRYTYTAKYLLIRDTNGNVIDSIDGSSYAKPSSIMPDSVGEDTMLKIKQDLYKNRR